MDDDDYTKSSVVKWIAGIVVLIIILALFLSQEYGKEETFKENLYAEAWYDKRIVRVGEIINFTSERCKGEIEEYLWDFDDGETSSDPNPSHIFHEPRWHNVTLVIKDKSGDSKNDTIDIGVQPQNIYSMFSCENQNDLGGEGYEWTGNEVQIGPNSINPYVKITVDIFFPVGTYEIQIWVNYTVEGNKNVRILLETSPLISKYDNLHYVRILNPENLFDEVSKYPTKIDVIVTIEEGRWDSASCYIFAAFPRKFELTVGER